MGPCTRERVTLTAMIEALGRRLDEDPELLAADVAELAYLIDRKRSSRR